MRGEEGRVEKVKGEIMREESDRSCSGSKETEGRSAIAIIKGKRGGGNTEARHDDVGSKLTSDQAIEGQVQREWVVHWELNQ
jgi:hypothetical protein